MIYELNNFELGGKFEAKKSGQKVSTQNWLDIHICKLLLNPNQCNKSGTKGKKEKPVVDTVTGQQFPPPPR